MWHVVSKNGVCGERNPGTAFRAAQQEFSRALRSICSPFIFISTVIVSWPAGPERPASRPFAAAHAAPPQLVFDVGVIEEAYAL